MGHFAKVVNRIVTEVIVAEQDVIDAFPDADLWVQTSYNTLKGEHLLGGTPLRKNFAGVGFTYDSDRDAFIPPSPHRTWVLNETESVYKCPQAVPDLDENQRARWSDDLYESTGNGWIIENS